MMAWRKAKRLLTRAAGPLRSRWVAALALLVGVSGMVVLAAHQDGFSAQAVDLGAGSVWVASDGPGQLALLDGASAEIAVKLRVAADNDDIEAITGTGAGYAVDRTTGTVLRVDNATWHPGDAHVLIDGSTAGLTAIAGDHGLFVTDVQRGLAIRADPTTLQPDGGPRSLSATPGPGSPVLDSRGVLWLLDAQRGNLIRMTDAPQIVQSGIADPARGRLVLADDRPVVVDLGAGTATPIDPGDGSAGATACVDVNASDATVRVLGSTTADQVYAVSGADGVLRITDLDTGDCSATVPDIAPPGSDLGQPVEADGHVFVPDVGTGQVIVVDLATRTFQRTQALVEPGADFDLIGHDGFAFYNQRSSDRAGVIDPDGTVRTVAKYDVDDPGKGIFVPQPDPTSDPTSLPAGPDSTSPEASAAAGSPTAQSPDDVSAAAGTPTVDTPATVGGNPTAPPSTVTDAAPPSTPTPVIPLSPSMPTTVPTSPTPTSTLATSTPTTPPPASGADSSPVSPTSPTTPTPSSTAPTGQAPHVDAITITSFPNDGKILSGDVLTFAATVSGGTPDTWSWRLRYANDDGTPQNQVEHTSTDPSFSYPVDSGGSSFQKWIVDVTVTNATGTDDRSRVFEVDIVDGRPFQVNAVNAAPNPVVTGTQVTVAPAIQGPLLSCQWEIDDLFNTKVTGPTACDKPQSAPELGNYTVKVAAVSRQNTTATATQPLTVKNIDPPTVSACTPPSGVGAHENATISATAGGTVTAWHWKILRGNPPQDTGITGDIAGSFTFVPDVADTFVAEVWVSNASGDSAHQTCSFAVTDRTPPVHTITKTGAVRTGRVTLTVSDPESAVTSGSLTVHYLISSACSGEDGPPQTATASLSKGAATVTINAGSCLDTSPGAPSHALLPNLIEIESIDSTATSGGGTAVWTD